MARTMQKGRRDAVGAEGAGSRGGSCGGLDDKTLPLVVAFAYYRHKGTFQALVCTAHKKIKARG